MQTVFAKHTVFNLAGELNNVRGTLLATPGQEFPVEHLERFSNWQEHFVDSDGAPLAPSNRVAPEGDDHNAEEGNSGLTPPRKVKHR